MGPGVEDQAQGRFLAVKVGRENLNDDLGITAADSFDGESKMLRSPIREIVAGDCRDDNVLELQALNRFRHALGFIHLQSEGLGGGNRAKTACAGTMLACDHESRGALAPALPAIRALRALAHS